MHDTTPLYTASRLSCLFGYGKRGTVALDNVSFAIRKQEIVSVVGESGSGKTTLARVLIGMQRATGGELLFRGSPLPPRKTYWRNVQMVFQNPFAAFNQFFKIIPQLRDAAGILTPRPHPANLRHRINAALRTVALNPTDIRDKYPFELSGGQMQRLLLARIFLIRPQVLIADEPTSMIDACNRRSILSCLLSLRKRLDMTILFITHDIALASEISDRIIVLHKGTLVEEGPVERILGSPQEEYTKNLIDNAPQLDLKRLRSAG